MKTGTRPDIAVTTSTAKLRISADDVIADYRLAVRSRAASELSRREVLVGKAPFGISGEGKEIAQLAMAKAFRPGDWRSGYYRDQTFMFAVGLADISQYFAQLYADPDVTREPNSVGRQMLSHFASRIIDESGRWKDLLASGQSASDLSPVGAQMPRSVGLAWASKLYRSATFAGVARGFSRNGDEVCFATIGNAGTSEGAFWESLNAAGVLAIPLVISIWDDGYGISVPNALQTTKGSISAVLQGFQRTDGGGGIDLYTVKGHDYLACCDVYQVAVERSRHEHIPAVVHVTEMTQPQGHSTSGSHERYKSAERLRFETDFDPIRRMREWMLREELVDDDTLAGYERADRREVERIRERAYEAYLAPIHADRGRALVAIDATQSESGVDLSPIAAELRSTDEPTRPAHRHPRRGRRKARRRQPGLRGTPGEARRRSDRGYRDPRGDHPRPGSRRRAAWLAPGRGHPVRRLPALCPRGRRGRSRHAALADRWRAAGTGHHPDEGPPAPRDLAHRLADGDDPLDAPRSPCRGAARYDGGRRLLQHAVSRR